MMRDNKLRVHILLGIGPKGGHPHAAKSFTITTRVHKLNEVQLIQWEV